MGNRRKRRFAYMFCGVVCASSAFNSSADTFAEYQLKAAFLLRLSEFVDWQAAQDGRENFQLCVSAPEETFRAFEALNGRLIKGLPVKVMSQAEARNGDCALVFLGGKTEPFDGLVFNCAPAQGCLMVGETHQAVSQARTIIGLVRQDDRIRVEINLEAAKAAGLQIDSNLLDVATIVDSAS